MSKNSFQNHYGYLTTRGRKTGKPHKIEISFYYENGKIYLLAHKREDEKSTDWYHNLETTPKCTFEIGDELYNCKAISLKENENLDKKIRTGFSNKYGEAYYNSWYGGTNRLPIVLEILNE